MAIKAIHELVQGDRFSFGLHEFIVQSISTKRQNTRTTDPEFIDVVMVAETDDKNQMICGFFSEDLMLDVTSGTKTV